MTRARTIAAAVVLALVCAGCTGAAPHPPPSPASAEPSTASPETSTPSSAPTPAPTSGPSTPRPAPSAAGRAAYRNPVYRHDGGDPAVIRGEDGSYYAFTTNSTYAGRTVHIPTLRSSDLVHWRFVGDALPRLPSWAHGDVWGPDIRRFGGRFVLLFAARDRLTGSMQLGEATAPTAAGPYRPGGRLVDWQHERIDPDVLTAADGSKILYWTEGNDVLAARFDTGDLHVRGPRRTVLLPIGEEGTGYQSVVEGTWAMRHGGWFYLFTSGDRCCVANPHYAVSVARSRSPFGPFVRFEGNPILAANEGFRGPGHCSVITDAAGRDWIVYHAMPAWSPSNARMLMVDRLRWHDGWPEVNGGRGPSRSSSGRPSVG